MTTVSTPASLAEELGCGPKGKKKKMMGSWSVADDGSEEFVITEEELAEIDPIEEFYNSCHLKANGRFCGKAGGKKGKIQVPMSEQARRSNAILRAHAAAKRSKEYKVAQQRARGSWADREKGQGGLRGVKGANSKKADAARTKNAKTGANTKKWKTDPQLQAIAKKYGAAGTGTMAGVAAPKSAATRRAEVAAMRKASQPETAAQKKARIAKQDPEWTTAMMRESLRKNG